jgi:hypothetical protein
MAKCSNNPRNRHHSGDIMAENLEYAYAAMHACTDAEFSGMHPAPLPPPPSPTAIDYGEMPLPPVQASPAHQSAESHSDAVEDDDDEWSMDPYYEPFLRAHGLYVHDSPLCHRVHALTSVQIADMAFPGCARSEEHEREIVSRSNDILDVSLRSDMHSLQAYTERSYLSINATMRGDSNAALDHGFNPAEIQDDIHHMKHIMQDAGNALAEDTVFYRRFYMKDGNESADRGNEELAYYHAVAAAGDGDDVIVDNPGFVSTTMDTARFAMPGHHETQFIIKAPAGTRGLAVDSLSGYHHEHKFLIDHGYRYRIVGIFETSDMISHPDADSMESNAIMVDFDAGKPVIALEIIPDSSHDPEP